MKFPCTRAYRFEFITIKRDGNPVETTDVNYAPALRPTIIQSFCLKCSKIPTSYNPYFEKNLRFYRKANEGY